VPASLELGDQTGFVWRTSSSPTAVVVLVHGLQSHAGWFLDAGARLAAQGLAVYAPDRRGSGRSGSPRGDIRDYRDWLADVEAVVTAARTTYPGTTVHLVGHCFGANLALGVALRKQVPVASVAMLTPGLYVQPDYRLLDKVRVGLAALISPRTYFRVPQDDGLFSRDPGVLEWIGRDELGARRVTARCLLQVSRLLAELREGIAQLDVPLLVCEASRDRLSDNRRNRRLLEATLGSRCRWLPFDAEHFLLAEPCAEQVVSELAQWARAHSAPKELLV
jgi:alpha-beta hydrolase superfamily lysophospholipase